MHVPALRCATLDARNDSEGSYAVFPWEVIAREPAMSCDSTCRKGPVMYRLLICACFVGAMTSLCESAELEKIDLLTVPEGIREIADEAAPEVSWQSRS